VKGRRREKDNAEGAEVRGEVFNGDRKDRTLERHKGAAPNGRDGTGIKGYFRTLRVSSILSCLPLRGSVATVVSSVCPSRMTKS
jgi:hypothetical protein